MKESCVNKYVVERKAGHPGATTFTIYSNREDMAEMVRALSSALSTLDAPRAEAWPPANLLWQQSATIAGDATQRASFAFCFADDLAQFHVRPGLASRLCGWLRVACWLVFIVFAGIGISATLSGYILVSPIIKWVLFMIPIVGIAVGLLWLEDRRKASRIKRKRIQ